MYTAVTHETLADFSKMDPEKIGEQYDNVAHLYEDYMEFLGYPDPDFITKSLNDVCKVPKDAKIMDMGMGTGIIGQHLINAGYFHIDGCDASQGLLDIAKKKGQYKDQRFLFLLKDPLPEEWIGQYDAVVSAGLLTHDHCGPDCLDEQYKCLKPGGAGIISFTTRPCYMEELGYQKKLDQMIADKKLEYVDCLKFTRYAKSGEHGEAQDERFKPAEVGTYIYRAIWQ